MRQDCAKLLIEDVFLRLCFYIVNALLLKIMLRSIEFYIRRAVVDIKTIFVFQNATEMFLLFHLLKISLPEKPSSLLSKYS